MMCFASPIIINKVSTSTSIKVTVSVDVRFVCCTVDSDTCYPSTLVTSTRDFQFNSLTYNKDYTVVCITSTTAHTDYQSEKMVIKTAGKPPTILDSMVTVTSFSASFEIKIAACTCNPSTGCDGCKTACVIGLSDHTFISADFPPRDPFNDVTGLTTVIDKDFQLNSLTAGNNYKLSCLLEATNTDSNIYEYGKLLTTIPIGLTIDFASDDGETSSVVQVIVDIDGKLYCDSRSKDTIDSNPELIPTANDIINKNKVSDCKVNIAVTMSLTVEKDNDYYIYCIAKDKHDGLSEVISKLIYFTRNIDIESSTKQLPNAIVVDVETNIPESPYTCLILNKDNKTPNVSIFDNSISISTSPNTITLSSNFDDDNKELTPSSEYAVWCMVWNEIGTSKLVGPKLIYTDDGSVEPSSLFIVDNNKLVFEVESNINGSIKCVATSSIDCSGVNIADADLTTMIIGINRFTLIYYSAGTICCKAKNKMNKDITIPAKSFTTTITFKFITISPEELYFSLTPDSNGKTKCNLNKEIEVIGDNYITYDIVTSIEAILEYNSDKDSIIICTNDDFVYITNTIPININKDIEISEKEKFRMNDGIFIIFDKVTTGDINAVCASSNDQNSFKINSLSFVDDIIGLKSANEIPYEKTTNDEYLYCVAFTTTSVDSTYLINKPIILYIPNYSEDDIILTPLISYGLYTFFVNSPWEGILYCKTYSTTEPTTYEIYKSDFKREVPLNSRYSVSEDAGSDVGSFKIKCLYSNNNLYLLNPSPIDVTVKPKASKYIESTVIVESDVNIKMEITKTTVSQGTIYCKLKDSFYLTPSVNEIIGFKDFSIDFTSASFPITYSFDNLVKGSYSLYCLGYDGITDINNIEYEPVSTLQSNIEILNPIKPILTLQNSIAISISELSVQVSMNAIGSVYCEVRNNCDTIDIDKDPDVEISLKNEQKHVNLEYTNQNVKNKLCCVGIDGDNIKSVIVKREFFYTPLNILSMYFDSTKIYQLTYEINDNRTSIPNPDEYKCVTSSILTYDNKLFESSTKVHTKKLNIGFYGSMLHKYLMCYYLDDDKITVYSVIPNTAKYPNVKISTDYLYYNDKTIIYEFYGNNYNYNLYCEYRNNIIDYIKPNPSEVTKYSINNIYHDKYTVTDYDKDKKLYCMPYYYKEGIYYVSLQVSIIVPILTETKPTLPDYKLSVNDISKDISFIIIKPTKEMNVYCIVNEEEEYSIDKILKGEKYEIKNVNENSEFDFSLLNISTQYFQCLIYIDKFFYEINEKVEINVDNTVTIDNIILESHSNTDANIIVTVSKKEDEIIKDKKYYVYCVAIPITVENPNYFLEEVNAKYPAISSELNDKVSYEMKFNSLTANVRYNVGCYIYNSVNYYITNAKVITILSYVNAELESKFGHNDITLTITSEGSSDLYCRLYTGKNENIPEFSDIYKSPYSKGPFSIIKDEAYSVLFPNLTPDTYYSIYCILSIDGYSILDPNKQLFIIDRTLFEPPILEGGMSEISSTYVVFKSTKCGKYLYCQSSEILSTKNYISSSSLNGSFIIYGLNPESIVTIYCVSYNEDNLTSNIFTDLISTISLPILTLSLYNPMSTAISFFTTLSLNGQVKCKIDTVSDIPNDIPILPTDKILYQDKPSLYIFTDLTPSTHYYIYCKSQGISQYAVLQTQTTIQQTYYSFTTEDIPLDSHIEIITVESSQFTSLLTISVYLSSNNFQSDILKCKSFDPSIIPGIDEFEDGNDGIYQTVITGSTISQITIDNLKPNTKYHAYCLLYNNLLRTEVYPFETLINPSLYLSSKDESTMDSLTISYTVIAERGTPTLSLTCAAFINQLKNNDNEENYIYNLIKNNDKKATVPFVDIGSSNSIIINNLESDTRYYIYCTIQSGNNIYIDEDEIIANMKYYSTFISKPVVTISEIYTFTTSYIQITVSMNQIGIVRCNYVDSGNVLVTNGWKFTDYINDTSTPINIDIYVNNNNEKDIYCIGINNYGLTSDTTSFITAKLSPPPEIELEEVNITYAQQFHYKVKMNMNGKFWCYHTFRNVPELDKPTIRTTIPVTITENIPLHQYINNLESNTQYTLYCYGVDVYNTQSEVVSLDFITTEDQNNYYYGENEKSTLQFSIDNINVYNTGVDVYTSTSLFRDYKFACTAIVSPTASLSEFENINYINNSISNGIFPIRSLTSDETYYIHCIFTIEMNNRTFSSGIITYENTVETNSTVYFEIDLLSNGYNSIILNMLYNGFGEVQCLYYESSSSSSSAYYYNYALAATATITSEYIINYSEGSNKIIFTLDTNRTDEDDLSLYTANIPLKSLLSNTIYDIHCTYLYGRIKPFIETETVQYLRAQTLYSSSRLVLSNITIEDIKSSDMTLSLRANTDGYISCVACLKTEVPTQITSSTAKNTIFIYSSDKINYTITGLQPKTQYYIYCGGWNTVMQEISYSTMISSYISITTMNNPNLTYSILEKKSNDVIIGLKLTYPGKVYVIIYNETILTNDETITTTAAETTTNNLIPTEEDFINNANLILTIKEANKTYLYHYNHFEPNIYRLLYFYATDNYENRMMNKIEDTYIEFYTPSNIPEILSIDKNITTTKININVITNYTDIIDCTITSNNLEIPKKDNFKSLQNVNKLEGNEFHFDNLWPNTEYYLYCLLTNYQNFSLPVQSTLTTIQTSDYPMINLQILSVTDSLLKYRITSDQKGIMILNLQTASLPYISKENEDIYSINKTTITSEITNLYEGEFDQLKDNITYNIYYNIINEEGLSSQLKKYQFNTTLSSPEFVIKQESTTSVSILLNITSSRDSLVECIGLENNDEVPTAEDFTDLNIELSQDIETTYTIHGLKSDTSYHIYCYGVANSERHLPMKQSIESTHVVIKTLSIPTITIESLIPSTNSIKYTLKASTSGIYQCQIYDENDEILTSNYYTAIPTIATSFIKFEYGLLSSKSYKLECHMIDNVNTESLISKKEFTTIADSTTPPTLTNINIKPLSQSIIVTAKLNQDGYISCKAQLISIEFDETFTASDPLTVTTANEIAEIIIPSLKSETDYNVYCTGYNMNDVKVSTQVKDLTFKTKTLVIPTMTVLLIKPYPSSVDIEIESDLKGSIYCLCRIVYDSSPSWTTLKLLSSDNKQEIEINKTVSITISNLLNEMEYTLYCGIETENEDKSDLNVNKQNFRTTNPYPELTVSLQTTTSNSIDLLLYASSDGTVYCLPLIHYLNIIPQSVEDIYINNTQYISIVRNAYTSFSINNLLSFTWYDIYCYEIDDNGIGLDKEISEMKMTFRTEPFVDLIDPIYGLISSQKHLQIRGNGIESGDRFLFSKTEDCNEHTGYPFEINVFPDDMLTHFTIQWLQEPTNYFICYKHKEERWIKTDYYLNVLIIQSYNGTVVGQMVDDTPKSLYLSEILSSIEMKESSFIEDLLTTIILSRPEENVYILPTLLSTKQYLDLTVKSSLIVSKSISNKEEIGYLLVSAILENITFHENDTTTTTVEPTIETTTTRETVETTSNNNNNRLLQDSNSNSYRSYYTVLSSLFDLYDLNDLDNGIILLEAGIHSIYSNNTDTITYYPLFTNNTLKLSEPIDNIVLDLSESNKGRKCNEIINISMSVFPTDFVIKNPQTYIDYSYQIYFDKPLECNIKTKLQIPLKSNNGNMKYTCYKKKNALTVDLEQIIPCSVSGNTITIEEELLIGNQFGVVYFVNQRYEKKKSNGGAIAGGIIGGLLAVILIVGVSYYVYRSYKRKHQVVVDGYIM